MNEYNITNTGNAPCLQTTKAFPTSRYQFKIIQGGRTNLITVLLNTKEIFETFIYTMYREEIT